MAQLELMPSDVSGEAYVLPYKTKNGMVAQFQLGYQGLVTLFYRAGIRAITAEIVYKKDKFEYTNGQVTHTPDVFADDRGEAIGAYVIIETQNGGKISKVMKKADILDIGSKFSKSYNSDFTPWKEANDPELWMWRKTVLKQASKLVPKNETIYKAIAKDNEDSIINERMQKAQKESESLKMGNLLKENNNKYDKTNKENNKENNEESQSEAEQKYTPENN
jgi:recombination protein RecT